MLQTNYQFLKRLTRIVKDEETRYKLIFLDTVIGSYKARKKGPDNFKKEKQITGTIYEAEHIAETREDTLNLLKTNSPLEVLKKRFQETSQLEEKIPRSALSSYFRYFTDNGSMCKCGKRLETRIMSGEQTITESMREHEIKRKFYNEADSMLGALFFEFQCSKDKHRY